MQNKAGFNSPLGLFRVGRFHAFIPNVFHYNGEMWTFTAERSYLLALVGHLEHFANELKKSLLYNPRHVTFISVYKR